MFFSIKIWSSELKKSDDQTKMFTNETSLKRKRNIQSWEKLTEKTLKFTRNLSAKSEKFQSYENYSKCANLLCIATN